MKKRSWSDSFEGFPPPIPAVANPGKSEIEKMQSRSHGHGGVHTLGASARRRIRRTSHGHPYYCSTNGCTTYLVPDAMSGVAICPVCGARRRLH
jgi:hypothetical protein